MGELLITVIIPVYNVKQYVKYCIESIIHQSYRHLEIIMIDDGSTDGSGEICDHYADKDCRIKVYHQQNQGISASRNFGIEQASGSYICFVDSDDYIHPRFLETLLENMSEEVSFSMVLGKRTTTHDESFSSERKDSVLYDKSDMLKGLFGTSDQEIQYQAIWNKLFRKELIDDIRFKEIVAEDVEFMMQVYLKTKKMAFIPQEMYFYFQRPDSITHQDTNSNNQIIRERFIHNLDTYYQIYTYIPEGEKEYQAWCLWKLYKRIFNVRYYAYSTPFKGVAKKTIHNVKHKTWNAAMSNPMLPKSQKWALRLLYHFPLLYKLMMWKNTH